MQKQGYPKYLYKFRYFDDKEYHIRILKHNELFFSSPGSFNDPFDSKIPVRYDKFERNEFFIYWNNYLKKAEPALNRSGRKQRVKEFYKEFTSNREKAIEQALRIAEELPSQILGVYSLAGDYKNLLLWSHYSNSHTGFAVGLDSQMLRKFCISHVMKTGQKIALEKVEYSQEYPIINAYRESTEERFKKELLTKSVDWSYENEYRLILQEGGNRILLIPDGTIRRVIMGCQTLDKNRDKLIEILKERNDKLSLFRAVKKKDSFGLNFEYVKY